MNARPSLTSISNCFDVIRTSAEIDVAVAIAVLVVVVLVAEVVVDDVYRVRPISEAEVVVAVMQIHQHCFL
jgi:hypothetical protein